MPSLIMKSWFRTRTAITTNDPEKGLEPSSSSTTPPLEQVITRSQPPKLTETTLSISGMTCSSCTSAITSALTQPSISSLSISLLSASALVKHDASVLSAEAIAEMVEDCGFGVEVVDSKLAEEESEEEEEKNSGLVKSVFSVEGMTCSACTGTLMDALCALPHSSDPSVSLASHSCSLTHDPTALPTSSIMQTIEDAGYGAEHVRSEPINSPGTTNSSSEPKKRKGKEKEITTRTVTLKLEHLDSPTSVTTVLSLLSPFPLTIATPPTPTRPLLTLTYTPTPTLTIRHLLTLLHPFNPSPYTPPTLSSLSRLHQQAHLRTLLLRFTFSLLLAVPTFTIGILGMLVLPTSSLLSQTCMAQTWGGAATGTLILFALATPCYFLLGSFFHTHAFTALRAAARRRPFRPSHLISFGNMDTLVSLSITVAYWSSLGMLARDVTLGKGNGTGSTYFDSVVFLVFFILGGRCLEARARVMTGDAIAMLGALRPETADLIIPEDELPSSPTSVEYNEKEALFLTPPQPLLVPLPPASRRTISIPLSHLELHDHILLRPGSLPPADGLLLPGSSTTFDESSLTGESVPVPKGPGDLVYTGTTNLTSAVVLDVIALGDETMLERIVRAVGDAQGRKAPVELLADRITGVFVPVIVWISVAVLAAWLAAALSGGVPASYITTSDLGGGATDTPANRVFFSFAFAISVLVVACPCGIGLAAPTAQAVGAGLAAKMGVLAQGGGEAFQLATRVDTVVFDKTGTLTVGEARVEDTLFLSAGEEKWLREAVRVLEEGSSHPLGAALREYCAGAEGGVELLESEEVAGRGAKGMVRVRGGESFDVILGNEPFMHESGAAYPPEAAVLEAWKADGKSVVLVAVRPASSGAFEVAALFSIADAPRPDTAASIETLRRAGKDVWMLSGDNVVTARAVARRVGIEEANVIAGVLPHEKAEHIRGLQAGGRRGKRDIGLTARTLERLGMRNSEKDDEKAVVLFCGDGLNDSAAIAAADVGVALGHGSQISVAAADFIILSSSLSTLPSLMRLSARVYRRQKQNFAWALVYNCAALPLAAGVFYPAGHTRLPPVWSALAMALSSVSVVTSSLALKWGI